MVSITVGNNPGPYIDATSIGAEVGRMTLASGAASGTTSDWSVEAAGYVADGPRFRLPHDWDKTITGFVVEAVQDGDRYGRKRVSEARYFEDEQMQLGRSGETLAVSYRRNSGGIDGDGDWIEVKVGPDGPLTAAVVVKLYVGVLNPGIGLTNSAFEEYKTTQRAKDAAQDASIASLERGEGQTGGPGLTAVASNETLTGTGTATDPLAVANPYPQADESKLAALPDEGAGNADKFIGFDDDGNYVAKDQETNTGESNPQAATQQEAEAGTLAALRSWSPLRIAQAIAALATQVTSLAWGAIMGPPATATRWPSYAEVTGDKPDAQADDWREYDEVLRGTYALQQGATAGQTYDTSVDLLGGDDEVTISVAGTDSAAISRTSLPALAAGVNSVLTNAGLEVTIGGQRYRVGLTGDRVVFASETVNENASVQIKASGHRLKDFADRRKNARAGRDDLPSDVAYDADLPENLTDLDDTPASYAGQAGKVLKVAAGEDSLEFADDRTGGGGGDGEANPVAVTQAQAEAGTATGLRSWSPLRVAQAIAALSGKVLKSLAALPAVATRQVGDIVNVGGALYELVAGTVDPHVYRGVLEDRTGDFVGDDVFNWDDATDAINANLSKAVLGGSPPATLWVEVHSGGYYAETELSRASGSDTNDTYAYSRTSDEAALETDTVTVGQPFDVSFYTDEAKQTAFRVQSASANRWERDDRDAASVNPVALLGNVVRWAKSKLPSDTLYTDSDLPDAMILDAAKSPRTSADRGRFLGTAKDDENALALLTRPEIPRGTAYPTNPDIGDEFILLHAVDFPQPRRFAVRQADADRRDIQLGGSGVVAIVAYSSTYTGANQAELRDKVFLQYAGSVPTEQQRYNVLQLGRDRYAPTNYAAATTAVGGGLQHLFEVSGIDYDAFTGNWWVDLERPQGGDKFPARQQEAGHYIYDAQDEWILAPGVAAPWATQGQPEPRTLLAITSLHDGVATGLSVPDPQTATRTPSAPILFAPAFDLDDDDHRTGIVQVEAVVSIATPAAPSNASFTSIANNSDAVRSIGRAVFTFASTLRDSTAYAAGAENGVQVGADIPVYLGATHLGNVKLFVTKNGDNALGYYMTWENVGAGSTALSFGLSLAGVFLHQDGPAQAAASKTMFAHAYRPAAAVNFPVTNAQPGAVYVPEWTAWTTIETSAAITAAQAGDVFVVADFEVEVFNPAPAGGGDRLMSEFRIVRTRAGGDTVLVDEIVYGPRNLGNAPAEFNAVSRFASSSATWADEAQAGDVYKVQGRVMSQNPERSARCPAGANGLIVTGME